MTWTVRFAPEFVGEFQALPALVQVELLAQARVIERFGPQARRPRIDTLKGSRYLSRIETLDTRH